MENGTTWKGRTLHDLKSKAAALSLITDVIERNQIHYLVIHEIILLSYLEKNSILIKISFMITTKIINIRSF